jgi:hypothetical protein
VRRGVAAPAPPGEMLHPLTFFLTVDERRAVLRALGRRHVDRARALVEMCAGRGAIATRGAWPWHGDGAGRHSQAGRLAMAWGGTGE